MTSGVITHIQRVSVHDKPEIRITVFLKGCQMHYFANLSPEFRQLVVDRLIRGC